VEKRIKESRGAIASHSLFKKHARWRRALCVFTFWFHTAAKIVFVIRRARVTVIIA
jgi:hypothetical protein